MKKITKRNTQGREKERKENTRGKVVSLKGKKNIMLFRGIDWGREKRHKKSQKEGGLSHSSRASLVTT